MGRLDGRVAVVTGASRGIGKAIAARFASEGAAIAVVARTERQADERMPGTVHDTVAEIRAGGGTALAVPADLADPEQVETVVERARATLGPVDILVNNAALTIPGRPPRAGSPPREPAEPRPAPTAAPTGPGGPAAPGIALNPGEGPYARRARRARSPTAATRPRSTTSPSASPRRCRRTGSRSTC